MQKSSSSVFGDHWLISKGEALYSSDLPPLPNSSTAPFLSAIPCAQPIPDLCSVFCSQNFWKSCGDGQPSPLAIISTLFFYSSVKFFKLYILLEPLLWLRTSVVFLLFFILFCSFHLFDFITYNFRDNQFAQMEALAALGLASNVTQFISFAFELISTSLEINDSVSGCADELSSLEAVYRRLDDLSAGLQSGPVSISPGPATLRNSTSTIKSLSRECQDDCTKLLEIIDNLKTTAVGWRGPKFWRSFRSALRTALKKGEIAKLEERLKRSQATLTLQICIVVR